MKALTNILTRLLMLMLLMLVACTEETAEVDNLTRGEQYLQVRMQVPGMTAAATRAADGEITSITALAFDSDGGFLKKVTINTVTNTNENGGYNGTFNLTIPNGTKNIHFLANLPENYDLSGVKDVEDLTTLTTTDYNNLVYWGMATYNGSTNTLSTTFYRNMAKISIKPSVEDVEFNQFKQEQLIIMGLDNPNTSGTLIPYNNGFHNTGVAPTYLTLPNGVTTLDKTPVGNDGAGYGYSLYVFEHANSNYLDKGLFVICKIGDNFYKVALTSDGKNPYQIIRNHEYIIYVSDVDDYAHDNNYRANNYDEAFDKKPINLEVKEVAQVAFSNTGNKTIDWNNGNPNSFDVAMSNIAEGTVTLTIAAEGFQVTQGGNELQKVEGNYTYTGSNTIFTFKPTIIGSHQITITGTGTYATVPTTTINVTVQASIKVDSATPTQLYYDSNDEQTVTVNVTIPTGVETLNISAADFIFGEEESGSYTYAVDSQTSAALSFKLNSGIAEAKTSTITISDASGNATQASVNIILVKTPVVTFTNTGNQTLYWNYASPTNFQVQMTGNNVPNDKTITLTITAADFTITAQNGTTLSQNGNVWTYTGTLTTLTFTRTSSGDGKAISITGEGENVNVDSANISVNVDATLLAVTTNATIDMDNSQTATQLTLTKPGNITNLKVTASNDNAFTINGNAINGDYYIGGLSSNNETINYTIALRDGFNTPGEYTISFTDANGGGQSVTATITIKNSPSLQFEYENNTTLYLDSNPQLPVSITVPDGSSLTQLNITATGFTVTASSEGLSGSEGSYTYTGGSTTFTFVPTTTDATEIIFTGTGTNLKNVNETITVNVSATKPAQGAEVVIYGVEHDASETGIIVTDNERPYLLLDKQNVENKAGNAESFRSYFTPGATIKIEFTCNVTESWHASNLHLDIGTIWTSAKFAAFKYENNNAPEPFSYTFTDNDFGGDNTDTVNGAGLRLMLRFVTINKISIIPAPTTE